MHHQSRTDLDSQTSPLDSGHHVPVELQASLVQTIRQKPLLLKGRVASPPSTRGRRRAGALREPDTDVSLERPGLREHTLAGTHSRRALLRRVAPDG
jgi:hypothetical protein